MLKARYIMIGGFLGAGKTTAILRMAEHLQAEGLRVGLITNDQSSGLVDTTLLRNGGFATEEITGGCFCCKFNSLVEAADQLTASTQPEVFLAEPVGSCTDLKATVSYPLSQMYGQQYAIAPLSVMVDPLRALRVLGVETGKNFSKKVLYIYKKQLEEADVIVINKCDLVDAERLGNLQRALNESFPRATVICTAARTGEGISAWLDVLGEQSWGVADAMEVDYDVYADGEALLGWVNGSFQLGATEPFDGNAWLAALGREIGHCTANAAGELAHLKMTLVPHTGNDVAIGNLVRDEAHMELSYQLVEPLQQGQLLINLRAECDPQTLQEIVKRVLRGSCDRHNIELTTERMEAFRPGRPTPTHRVT